MSKSNHPAINQWLENHGLDPDYVLVEGFLLDPIKRELTWRGRIRLTPEELSSLCSAINLDEED